MDQELVSLLKILNYYFFFKVANAEIMSIIHLFKTNSENKNYLTVNMNDR